MAGKRSSLGITYKEKKRLDLIYSDVEGRPDYNGMMNDEGCSVSSSSSSSDEEDEDYEDYLLDPSWVEDECEKEERKKSEQDRLLLGYPISPNIMQRGDYQPNSCKRMTMISNSNSTSFDQVPIMRRTGGGGGSNIEFHSNSSNPLPSNGIRKTGSAIDLSSSSSQSRKNSRQNQNQNHNSNHGSSSVPNSPLITSSESETTTIASNKPPRFTKLKRLMSFSKSKSARGGAAQAALEQHNPLLLNNSTRRASSYDETNLKQNTSIPLKRKRGVSTPTSSPDESPEQTLIDTLLQTPPIHSPTLSPTSSSSSTTPSVISSYSGSHSPLQKQSKPQKKSRRTSRVNSIKDMSYSAKDTLVKDKI